MTEPMSHELEDTVLELIANHDGVWGWYQLDRALSGRGILGVHVPTVVNGLAKAGFLLVEGDPDRASSRFRITDAGRVRLGRSEA